MILLTVACARLDPASDTDGGDVAPTEILDQRVTRPDPAEGIERWVTPEVVIPPYTEVLYCWAGTFAGDVRGLVSFESWQGEAGHHVALSTMPIGPNEMPDGTMLDCATVDIPLLPLVNPLPVAPHHLAYALPDDMAIKISPGARSLVQLHYINTTANPVRVQDVLDLGWRPVDEVETWAATFGVPTSDFRIPPGETYTLSLRCHMQQEVTALWIAGHMHEYGSHYTLERAHRDEGPRETLIDVPWTAAMRFEPPIVGMDGGVSLARGDVLTTTCTWENTTETELGFPTEMCGAPGMVYPAERPVFCQQDRD